MQVHQPARVLLNLPGIHEAPREFHAVLDVGRAAPPLPGLLVVVVKALLLLVASALAEVALAAGFGHCVSHPGRHDGVGERRLPAAWKEENLPEFRYKDHVRQSKGRCGKFRLWESEVSNLHRQSDRITAVIISENK